MNPIDKFTNIDAVYPITDAKEEDTLLDYVWELAMLIHPALPKKSREEHWREAKLCPPLRNDTITGLLKCH